MLIKDNSGNDSCVHVHHNGYLYYQGKNFPGCDIESITSAELALCKIQTDKAGRLYVQKGGQKKLYIDNARLTDKDGIRVKDYLAGCRDYEITVVLKCKVNAPDAVLAKRKAADIIADIRDDAVRDSADYISE